LILDPRGAGTGMNDRYWSVDEISGYLGVKRDTIYKWIVRRGLPAHKTGRLWKFRKHEVDDWVSSGDPTPSPGVGARGDGRGRRVQRSRE
jgi:excisionase family DNA binding protein